MSVWQGRLSVEGTTALVNAQAAYLKTAYGVTVKVTDATMYGLATNPTIDVRVSLKF